jgi:hypothetical protein
MPFDKLRIESQLQELRQRWAKEPLNRPLIKRQAKALTLALEEYQKKENPAYNFAKENFNLNS